MKAALRHYHRQESKLELQEQYRQEMRNYLRELAEEQGKVFLEKLAEHQTKKTEMQGYVGVLTIICFVTTVLSVIRQRAFCEDVLGFVQELGKGIQKFVVRMQSVILSVAEVTEKVPNDVAAVILKWTIVALLWVIPAALIGFGMYKFWKKHGEDIRNGIDVWNCSVAVVILVGLVYFGDYVKRIVAVNLFGMWLLLDVLLILAGWYVWGCKKYRGFY